MSDKTKEMNLSGLISRMYAWISIQNPQSPIVKVMDDETRAGNRLLEQALYILLAWAYNT
ncbi:unnamed protein product [Clonostachys byssicola]|uniref:Uncharacterized protein n=1 Tax=Clonostachys byssicola TaxID=160290 RepID=A0A9N9XZT7_9HYPO|nr:unnamed protein product [Clonostachys byssicola]